MKVKDYFNSGETFEIVSSDIFKELKQTIPQLSNKELNNYYSGEYISHNNNKNTLFEKVYSAVQHYNLDYKLKILKKHSINLKTTLDYGCGKGDFVHHLNQNGVKSFGYEPNKLARSSFTKLNNESSLLTQLSELNKYDAISLFHVLEHIPNFIEIFKALKNSLNPNGIIVLALPNYKSYDAKFYKEYWAAYDVPRHQWHFSQNSINDLSNHFGMELVNKYPLVFDSLYVSFLSEKYKKSGIIGQLRALGVGLISNLKAMSTHEYSSIIYVLKLKD